MALLSKSVATTCFTVEENNNYFQPIVLLHSMIGYWHRHARLLCGFLIKYRPYEYMRILSVRLSVCNAWSTIGYHSNSWASFFVFEWAAAFSCLHAFVTPIRKSETLYPASCVTSNDCHRIPQGSGLGPQFGSLDVQRWIAYSLPTILKTIHLNRHCKYWSYTVLEHLIERSSALRFWFPCQTDASYALTRWQHFSAWNDVMAAILKEWRQTENSTPTIDANLLEEQSRQISSPSDLKRRRLKSRPHWCGSQNNQKKSRYFNFLSTSTSKFDASVDRNLGFLKRSP